MSRAKAVIEVWWEKPSAEIKKEEGSHRGQGVARKGGGSVGCELTWESSMPSKHCSRAGGFTRNTDRLSPVSPVTSIACSHQFEEPREE